MYDLIFCIDHGILALQWLILILSGATVSDCSDCIAVTAVSLFARAAINIFNDNKLKQAEIIVNKKPVEKFIFKKKRKSFQLREW